MIQTLLAFGTIGAIEALIVLIGFALLIVLVIFIFRLLLRNKKENIRLRLEVGNRIGESGTPQNEKDSRKARKPLISFFGGPNGDRTRVSGVRVLKRAYST